jgi:hypothetical protein
MNHDQHIILHTLVCIAFAQILAISHRRMCAPCGIFSFLITTVETIGWMKNQFARTRLRKPPTRIHTLKNVDNLLTKRRWHRDEKMWLQELAFCLTRIFEYQDVVKLYEEEHANALAEAGKKARDAMEESEAVQQSQIDELKQLLEAAHALQEAHDAKKERRKGSKRADRAKAKKNKKRKRKAAAANGRQG